MEVSRQLYTPATLTPPGNIPQYPLDRKLSGSQSWPACSGEEKIQTPLIQPMA